MRLEPWRQESESRPPAPRHQPRPLCSHSQRAEALRVRRLKSPSNESGPDKVPIMREFQHASPGRESGDCPVFLQSSTIEEAEGADAWRVTPVSRGRRASRLSHSGLQAKKVQPTTLVQVTGIDAQCLFSPSHRLL